MPQSNAKHMPPHPPSSEIGTLQTVKARLVLLGWPSMLAWAEAHGYERCTVSYTIKTWGRRTDKRPHGGISKNVLRDLRATLDGNLKPADVPARNN